MGHKFKVAEIVGRKFTIEPECTRYDYDENYWSICPECEEILAQYPETFHCEIDAQACCDIINGLNKASVEDTPPNQESPSLTLEMVEQSIVGSLET